jgi:hypothetical protein
VKLQDQAGAVQDLRKGAKLFRSQGRAQELQVVISALKELGLSE